MRTCTICNRKYKASGFCERHYAQLMKYGEITFPIKKIQMITIQCRQCKKSWNFYPKFLESMLFDQVLRRSYEIVEGKKFITCSICQEFNKDL